ncbi:SH3-like domain-containing protein [Paraburkholderia sp. ZP32-5]|uniref:SH3-like domain-containing protein n=1 Tax=Paraburkholderia sp. ZP32-5 TaxID=2883245 RepID=UPI001F461E1A|nr:SH3-like domain-containing protein [Paraburkholderia sp. ZP32-5]
MSPQAQTQAPTGFSNTVIALDQQVLFQPGETVRVMTRSPIGHYRVPIYLRGKTGVVEKVLEPMQFDNEREGYGQNGGDKRHYYRIAFSLKELWPDYAGPAHDNLHIEVFENWLERS